LRAAVIVMPLNVLVAAHERLEPTTSVNKNVTVPIGSSPTAPSFGAGRSVKPGFLSIRHC
jgi:hypothetical protein